MPTSKYYKGVIFDFELFWGTLYKYSKPSIFDFELSRCTLY